MRRYKPRVHLWLIRAPSRLLLNSYFSLSAAAPFIHLRRFYCQWALVTNEITFLPLPFLFECSLSRLNAVPNRTLKQFQRRKLNSLLLTASSWCFIWSGKVCKLDLNRGLRSHLRRNDSINTNQWVYCLSVLYTRVIITIILKLSWQMLWHKLWYRLYWILHWTN